MPVLVQNAIKSKNREKRFRMLSHALMSISDSVWITDLEDRVVFVNEAFLRTYGYQHTEIIDKTIDIVFSRHNPEDLLQRLHRGTLQNGQELLCQKKNGEELPVFVSTSIVYDEFGSPLAHTGVAKDITEQKQARIELQNAKELAVSANQAKSEFLANMSHEIRTPMNSILGMTELTLDTKLTDEQREYLEIVRQSTESLLTVINDILDFSKIGAGKLELDEIEFSLRDSLHELLKTFGLRAHQKRVELVNYIASDVPDRLRGDPVRLRQILVNLIGNALKFTDEGFVDLRIVTEWYRDDQVFLHFMLTDTGIGIPDDQKAHIFRSFEQADGTTSRKYGGTGLGLAISSQLVNMMQGEMWVESPVDFNCHASDDLLPHSTGCFKMSPDVVGSRFHFTAVLKVQQVQPSFIDEGLLSQMSGLRVLVIDDNRTNLLYIRELLASWNCIPETACSRDEALRRLDSSITSRRHFDVVLLDLSLRDTEAFDIIDRIREKDALKTTAVIPMTAVFDPNERKFQRYSGIGFRLTKPVYPVNVVRTILAAISKIPMSENDALGREGARREQRSKPLKVLVADDNLSNQKLVTHLLGKLGHNVTVVNNGKEVVERHLEGSFDLILMDIQMPIMDGFQAIHIIRDAEKSGERHVPAIALTANAMKGYMERCLKAGFNGYVSKPIRRRELFNAIQNVYREQPEPAGTN
jgi:PAS domain S-box-containing protein